MNNDLLTIGVYEKAVQKIDAELKAFKGGNKETAVKQYIADTIKEFCRQEVEFAEAVLQTEKTLSDCCSNIMKGVGTHASDLEVYKKAAHFYFPGCSVHMTMSVDLIGAVSSEDRTENKPASLPAAHARKLDISLDDLLL